MPWAGAGVSREPGRPAYTPHTRGGGRGGLPWPSSLGPAEQARSPETRAPGQWSRGRVGTRHDRLSGAIGSHLLSGGHAEGGPRVCGGGGARAPAQAEPRPGDAAEPDAGGGPSGPASPRGRNSCRPIPHVTPRRGPETLAAALMPQRAHTGPSRPHTSPLHPTGLHRGFGDVLSSVVIVKGAAL